MADYYIKEGAMQSTYAKVENGRVFAWVDSGGEPNWEEGDFTVEDMRPFYSGEEEGFIAKVGNAHAFLMHQISKDAF